MMNKHITGVIIYMDLFKKYRNLAMGLLAGVVVALILAPTFAGATASSVGVIDLDKAVSSHPQFKANTTAFEAFKGQQNVRLDVYRNKETLTDSDKEAIVNLRKDIDEQISAKYKELFDPLTQDVINAVKKVGIESGIEAILDSQAVLYGGLDLTPAVTNELGG